MGIIRSLLDTDLYKFTMMNAILCHKKQVPVEYRFINRNLDMKFNNEFIDHLKYEIGNMSKLKVTDEEICFLINHCPYLSYQFVEYLRNYQFNPKEVEFGLDNQSNLNLVIKGPWERTILWEVPLMALISELYFKICDTDWQYAGQQANTTIKSRLLSRCRYIDFGTRRRRSYESQLFVLKILQSLGHGVDENSGFMGTSNVHFAHQLGLKPYGTMAHEWIQGISVLESLRHANRYALRIWHQVYRGKLGYALPDTFGSQAFFEDFDDELARLFEGVRHDSGDPIEFGEKVIQHYKSLGIDPKTKVILFSDNINADRALELKNHFGDQIRLTFCIGTNFTNDFRKRDSDVVSKPLNMVIKLFKCDGVPVVKLSDSPTKQSGDPDALRVARWTFNHQPLDNKQ